MKKARGGKSNATVTLKEKRNVPTQIWQREEFLST
jgi:hypothetical protein